MACISPEQLYHLERNKIGFNGQKRQVYEAWQFTNSFMHHGVIYMIEKGWKYVHESACHPRRLKDVKYITHLQGKYYKQPTQYISLKDWQDGIVKCINEKIHSITYSWYGTKVRMTCVKQKINRYIVHIHTDNNIYLFKIRVESPVN